MTSPTILLVSNADTVLSRARRKILDHAGYRIAGAGSLGLAISLTHSLRVNLVILEEGFSDCEKAAFIEVLHESHPGLCVLCLGHGYIQPDLLLVECRSILTAQTSGGGATHFLYTKVPHQRIA